MTDIDEARFNFEAPDKARIVAYRWRYCGIEPRAILQVAHGALEHSARYRDRLLPLMRAGLVIYSADHRGHGLTAHHANRGDFGSGGASACILDMAHLSEIARAANPGLPLFLLGHSMGAGFAQLYLRDHSALIEGLILSGTAMPAPPLPGGWNSVFIDPRTPADWLSRDSEEVDRYLSDPRCGGILTESAETSLAALRDERAAFLANMQSVRRVPVYIFCGDRDPVNRGLNLLTPLIEAFTGAGLDVRVKIYKGGRHEMLNETNRSEVLADLLDWLNQAVSIGAAPRR